MKNKRGSHVGMIISFTLFITFITFIYAMLNPVVNKGEDKEAMLKYIEDKILEEVSANLSIVSLNIKKDINENCINFPNFFSLSNTSISKRMIVKNQSDQIQTAYYNINYPSNILVDRGNSEITFLRFYISDQFEEVNKTAAECKLIQKEDYNISAVSKSDYIFEDEIIKLIDYYNYESDNYQYLKNKFNIPSSTDFGFIFKLSNGSEISAVKKIPLRTNVYVKEKSIRYMNNKAEVISGFIKIKVW